jgi:lipopolysaccharide biosynthesis regulator YciM
MNKIRLLFLLVVTMAASIVHAQGVDQAKRFIYYERFKSAKDALEKALASNPNDITAMYWLGQVNIDMKDIAAAKALYQRGLASNGTAPLLLVGMGQIELLEGKTNEAKQRFETAISLTKGKDIQVLNAIARANVDAKAGDANYAIEKATLATQIKGFNDPETYLLIGDAYRKNIDGGGAVSTYNKALGLNPKLAAAKYKIGKVYLTQNNKEYFLPAFEESIQMDPAYLPALYELFYYYYFRDVNKAETYLNQYVANADQGPDIDYLRTDFTYAKGDFAGAKTKAQGLINQYGDKVNPRMYRMIAYTSDTLHQMAEAKQAMNTYMTKANPDDVIPGDYLEMANINSKMPGSEQEAFTNFQMAIDKDTSMENKIKYANQASDMAKKLGDLKQQAVWAGVAYRLNKNPSNSDLYKWGYANYQASNYDTAINIFCNMYQSKYPTEIFGYLWCARANEAKDTTWATGAAVQPYEKLAQMALQLDSAKYKGQAKTALFKLASYANDVKKDPKMALDYINQILAFDPADPNALQIQDILKKALTKPQKPATTTPAKKPTTKSGGGTAGAKKKK